MPPALNPRLARWTAMLTGERGMYVVVNLAVNVLFLVRSYVAMRVLDYAELGLVAVLQTIVLLVGTLQFGVVTGGYRLMCSETGEAARRINNLVYTFIGCVALACAAVAALALAWADNAALGGVTALGVAAGVMTLLRNWVANQMVARVQLARLNGATLASAAVSLAVLGFVPWAPLAACLASLVVQPAAFLVQVLAGDRSLRPDALALPAALLRRVLASGFVVFLTGLALQLNLQVERWYVVDRLGLDALGHLYVSILFMNIFQLVPTSLDALFLPRLVRFHGDARADLIGQDLRRFFLLALGYCVLATAALALLGEPLLRWLLPRYVPDLRYAWLFLPGLLAFTLASPLAIVFNVLIRYGTYLVAYGLGTLVLLAVLAASVASGHLLGLDQVSLLRATSYALIAAILVAGYLRVVRSEPMFRLRIFPARPGAAT
jgi:O-antigen/teichoic acid export membrane protein